MKNHNRFWSLILSSGMLLAGCSTPKKEGTIMYQSPEFKVYTDRVEQGEFKATALSDTEMMSNYKSRKNDYYSRAIEFKFSLNQKDNELPFNTNHRIVVYPKDGYFETPVIEFGTQLKDTKQEDPNDGLEPNARLKVRLDMSPVLKSFETKGYYEDIHGERLSKADFKGVFIAGGSPPLNWDFENLPEDRQLKDPDGDAIFEIELLMNLPDKDRETASQWRLSKDITPFPQFSSDQPLINALYNLSLEEVLLNSEADGTFRTGKKWAGVWTRDVSYSILLGLGMIDPGRSITSLRKKVKRNRIIQDTGSGGAWPVSSDRTTWALAAWETYLVTGDQGWLNEAYEIIKNSVEDDRKVILDNETGLMRGESSFLDWRKQTYPRWMDNVDIYRSMNLGTNVVHYQTYRILSEMASLLGENEDSQKYKDLGESLRQAINQHLWDEEKGYYTQYLYGRKYLYHSQKSESLGEALAILFGVPDNERAEKVITNTPVVPFGSPCVYPQIPGIEPYHNNGIWPFVQAYWNLAAAKTGNGEALEHGLAGLYRAAALFLTNKENMVAEDGDFLTVSNSDRQLWSVAGNLSMIYKVFFGMEITPEGQLLFHPVIPKSYAGKKELTNVKLRKKTLDIRISGFGNVIKTFKVDGKKTTNLTLNLNEAGHHKVEIVMADTDITINSQLTLVPNKFHLPTPKVTETEKGLQWKSIEGAILYEVFRNGKLLKTTDSTSIDFKNTAPLSLMEYTIRAKDAEDDYSFLSEPIIRKTKEETPLHIDIYRFAKDKKVTITKGVKSMVELSKKKNRSLSWSFTVKEKGEYFLWFDYTNGSGPWNTDNKCALRTLFVNGEEAGAIIMAQRGTDEWNNLGQTNAIKVNLQKGKNNLTLSFESYNENMNVEVNSALLGRMNLQKVSQKDQ